MAGLRVEVVVKGGLLVVVGVGVGALGAVAGRVRDLDKAPAVEHKARPSAVGDEPPGPVDLTEEEGIRSFPERKIKKKIGFFFGFSTLGLDPGRKNL